MIGMQNMQMQNLPICLVAIVPY